MEHSVSTLKTNTIQAATGSNVTIASGNVLQAPGHVLQVLQSTTTDTTTIASGATASAVLSQAITPSSTSNKILINISVNIGGVNNSYGHGQLKRGSTLIGAGAAADSRPQASFGLMSGLSSNFDYRMAIHNFLFLDSPSTTSATTYSVDLVCASGGMNLNRTNQDGNDTISPRGMSTITLMEIAG